MRLRGIVGLQQSVTYELLTHTQQLDKKMEKFVNLELDDQNNV